MVIAAAALGPVHSNIPLRPEWALPDDLRATGHTMIDFGDDRLTAGRPHPMIDPTLRLERLTREAADPAATLAPAVRAAARSVRVVVSLCGTSGDPQGLEQQASSLRDAGATVLLSNAAAAREAVSLVRHEANA